MIDELDSNGFAAYREYVALLRRLHATFRGDEDESPEADAIRELMDGPWYRMTRWEKELAGRLSEQLYAEAEMGRLANHEDCPS